MDIRSTGTTNVSEGLLAAHTHTLRTYRDVLRAASMDLAYASPESALASPSDERAVAHAEEIAREFGGPSLKTVILVGIGGSDLGTRAIYEALVAQVHTASHAPRLVPFGTIEPQALNRARDLFTNHEQPDELVLIVISKSGTTAETIANANVLFRAFAERFGTDAAARRTIVISDPGVPLVETVRNYSIRHMAMPEHIGGRFSVFTPVGLVPLAILGVDVRALCEGAVRAIRASVPEQGAGPGAMIAALLFEHYLNGATMHELFLFHPELETLGKWYRQLLAESIGKERADGTRVGIMPTVAIGSTDLHSLTQLVLGGPKNRFTTFVTIPRAWEHTPACADGTPFSLDILQGKEVGAVMRAITQGVQRAYRDHGLPYISMELTDNTPAELGAFMGLHMTVIMYLAKLFDVNAFDQPAVEAYKREARRILNS